MELTNSESGKLKRTVPETSIELLTRARCWQPIPLMYVLTRQPDAWHLYVGGVRNMLVPLCSCQSINCQGK